MFSSEDEIFSSCSEDEFWHYEFAGATSPTEQGKCKAPVNGDAGAASPDNAEGQQQTTNELMDITMVQSIYEKNLKDEDYVESIAKGEIHFVQELEIWRYLYGISEDVDAGATELMKNHWSSHVEELPRDHRLPAMMHLVKMQQLSLDDLLEQIGHDTDIPIPDM